MKKITGKNLLSLMLLKSAIIAGWYLYGKHLAKDANSNEAPKAPVKKSNETILPKDNLVETKNKPSAKTVKKSTSLPARKVAVKVVKKSPPKSLPLVKADKVVVDKVKKSPVKKKVV